MISEWYEILAMFLAGCVTGVAYREFWRIKRAIRKRFVKPESPEAKQYREEWLAAYDSQHRVLRGTE